jgi:tRNA-dihydrouridine synthase B
MTWYVKEFPGAAGFRSELCQMETVQQGEEILQRAIEQGQAGIESLERLDP